MITLSPAAIAAERVQFTSDETTEQLKPLPDAEPNTRPAASESVTLISPVVGPGETFFTFNNQIAGCPMVAAPLNDLVIRRSGTLTTVVVGSVNVLFAGVPSPVVATVTLFDTLGSAATDGVTVSVIATFAPATIGVVRAHRTFGDANEQVKSVPAALTYVRPAASESTTMIESVVAADPIFATVIVKIDG
jgi:spore maturation protein SpmB